MSDVVTTQPSNTPTLSANPTSDTSQTTPAPQTQVIPPQPQKGFTDPQPGQNPGPPSQGYTAPQPTQATPQQGYVVPAERQTAPQSYVPPQQGYTAPQTSQAQPSQGYIAPQPPQQGYNPTQQGYTPQPQPTYVPQQQPGYAPQQQPSYAPQQQPKYAPQQQPVNAPQQPVAPPGYNPQQQSQGYVAPQPPQQGYNPTQQQQSGYTPQQPPPPTGYEPQSQSGFAPQPPPPSGYGPQAGCAPQSGYTSQTAYAPPQPQVSEVAAQGNQNTWMPKPESKSACPPGLEYLTLIDQILVMQKTEILETLTETETLNKYKLVNSVGQQVYFATEETDSCLRNICGNTRGFIMHIVDNHGQEVMRVSREFKCSAGCCWCSCCNACALEVIIEAPVGEVIGKVKQTCSFLRPYFHITTAEDEIVLKIRGPVAQVPFCVAGQDFQVLDPDNNTAVGKISKERTGLIKEMFTRADNFGVTFPMNLDVKSKAAMIGAVFLIDLIYFERQFQLTREQTQAAATAASAAGPAKSMFSFFSNKKQTS